MASTLFISDLHLDESRPQHLEALADFLRQKAAEAEALYVLGDLFEAWIGDDDDSDFNRQVIALFRGWSDQHGGALFFMHGNRDFVLGEQFTSACGGQLLEEKVVVDLYGRPTLLMHGDSLCTRDEAYMAFRAQARAPQWQQAMLAKPLAERRMIAQQMRMKSAADNANKATNIMDVTPEEVVREMETASVKHLIHGHTHRPAVHDVLLKEGNGKRWVLGDWGSQVWYLVADQGGNRLINYPVDN